MGAWGIGAFQNDGALDFVADARSSPVETIGGLLRRVRDAPANAYFHTRDGVQTVAAAELVALGFGCTNTTNLSPDVLAVASAIGRDEQLRTLALEALPRIRDPEFSELAELWGEGDDDDDFDAMVADLIARLEAANVT